MTPPLCLHCRTQPVKRVWGSPAVTGPRRIVDGVRWGNYCSSRCTSTAIGLTYGGNPTSTAKLVARNQQSYRGRVRQRLIADAEPIAAQFHIPVDALMKALWAVEVRGYRRGFAACWAQQQRRKRIA